MFKKIGYLLKESGKKFAKHNPLLLGAAISFYIILALGPILVIMVFSVGMLFGEKAVQGQIVQSIQNFVGQQPAEVIQTIIKKAYQIPSKTISLLSSIPLLFFGGTMVFYQIRSALNLIWEVEEKNSGGFTERIKNYGFSLVMLFIVGILFIIIIIKTPIIVSLKEFLNQYIHIPGGFISLIDFIFNFLIITFLFAMIYIILPDTELKWSDVSVGAAVNLFFIYNSAIFNWNKF